MEALKFVFLLGALGILTGASALFGAIVHVVGAYWIPLVTVVVFCLAVVAIAYLVAEIEQRRRAQDYRKSVQSTQNVQTLQIRVEADTSGATAAIEQLEQRAKACAAQIEALNRLAIRHMMEKR